MKEERRKEAPEQVQLVFPFMEGFVQEDRGESLDASGVLNATLTNNNDTMDTPAENQSV